MKKKKKLIGTVVSLMLAITIMGFGVYAATSVTGKVQSSVSFVSKDVKCTFSVDVDGGKYLSGGVGTDEQEYRHKTQSVNNESVNAAHTLDEFVMGHYTFDPTTEAGKKITYTITITNNGSNEISIKYTANKKVETIANILQVTETNMQSVETIAVGGSYIGKIELSLLDSSADIALKDIDITYEISKAIPPTPLSSFTFGTPSNATVSLTKFTGTETEVVIPSRDANGNLITIIANGAFSGSSKITSVTIPKGVTSIKGYAFNNCKALKSIIIPESVTSISDYVFNNCSALTNITIPENVTSIGGYTFEGTTWYNNQPEGIVYAGKVLYKYKGTCPSVINNIKSDTLAIADEAFSSCSALTSVTIPSSVTSIGGSAFRACYALTSITIPNSVISLGYNAFASSGLTSITIPDSVIEMGGWIFQGCRSLESAFINNSITSISSGMFYECTSLIGITIPNSITTIGDSAFYKCGALSEVNIGSGVTSIGSSAFYECISLAVVTIPDNVESIGWNAFDSCNSLTDVYFERLTPFTYLGDWCFYIDEIANEGKTLYLYFKKDSHAWENFDPDGQCHYNPKITSFWNY